MSIDGFDPLSEHFHEGAPERGVIEEATQRVVLNILKSYTGYYDAFSEMIQNALDALDEAHRINPRFLPKLWIKIDLQKKQLTVIDNGVGMSLEQFKLCFRPSVSFKKRREYRGHKGVGATFLAYGFSGVKLQTIRPELSIGGILRQGRDWAEDSGFSIERPKFEECPVAIPELSGSASGTSIEIQIGNGQRPQLAWLQAQRAAQWLDVLRAKSPLGGVYLAGDTDRRLKFECNIQVTALDGSVDSVTVKNPEYYYPHEIQILHKVQDIDSIERKLASISGDPDQKLQKLPDEFRRLDAVYKIWAKEDLLNDAVLMRNIDEEERVLIERHDIAIYGCFVSTAKTWTELRRQKFAGLTAVHLAIG